MFCALMLGVALFYAWCGGRSLHEGATIGCAVDADNEKCTCGRCVVSAPPCVRMFGLLFVGRANVCLLCGANIQQSRPLVKRFLRKIGG